MKRSPMRARSAKQVGKDKSRQPVKRDYLASHRRCEAQVQGWCSGSSEHVHEPWTRARGGPINDARNMLALCFMCHAWVHSNPAESEQRGWLVSAANGPSWLESRAS